jgi:hypothetical protein
MDKSHTQVRFLSLGTMNIFNFNSTVGSTVYSKMLPVSLVSTHHVLVKVPHTVTASSVSRYCLVCPRRKN